MKRISTRLLDDGPAAVVPLWLMCGVDHLRARRRQRHSSETRCRLRFVHQIEQYVLAAFVFSPSRKLHGPTSRNGSSINPRFASEFGEYKYFACLMKMHGSRVEWRLILRTPLPVPKSPLLKTLSFHVFRVDDDG